MNREREQSNKLANGMKCVFRQRRRLGGDDYGLVFGHLWNCLFSAESIQVIGTNNNPNKTRRNQTYARSLLYVVLGRHYSLSLLPNEPRLCQISFIALVLLRVYAREVEWNEYRTVLCFTVPVLLCISKIAKLDSGRRAEF
mmetsp:Transcript_27447/g.60412  ORF Transcript_27447/g.60412 Transcript_27447/m.60412 type:complete len:141 (+) Transcript_27447:835-1257(+)